MYGAVLLLHVLAATVWTGGHLVLTLTVLPRVLRNRAPAELLAFESGYERVGMPALIVQVISGIWLAHRLRPDVSEWTNLDDPFTRLICIKLALLAITVALAADARLRLIPNLTEDKLVSLAWHIVSVTVVSVLFVIVGVSFRTGWFVG